METIMADDDKNFSNHFLEVDEDPYNERKAFFEEQADDLKKFKARLGKAPVGSRTWPNVSVEKMSDRKSFFDKQKAARDAYRTRRAMAKIPEMPMLPSKLWTGLSVEDIADRKKFQDLQKRTLPILQTRRKVDPSTGWFNISSEKTDQRKAFQTAQAAKSTTLGRTIQKGLDKAALLKGKAGSTSDQSSLDLAYSYHVALPGIGIMMGSFRRVSGISTDERVIETYHEGGDNGAEHFLVGHQKNGKIVMEWAVRHPDPFLIWWLVTGTGAIVHEPINISLLDPHGIPVAMWSILFSMATKIEFPELDAMSSEVATNKIELIHNGLIPIPI